MADEISGGDVYFARGGPRYPLAALHRKRDIRKINDMAWSGLAVGAGMGVMHVAAPPIQWQREEPVCGSCLVLDGGEACQIAQPQCSRRPRRWALLPGDLGTANRLLHKEASLWKDRYDLSETKRVRQGAGGGGAHSIAA